MNAAYVYLQLYRLFDGCTPVGFDCGKLCEKACCTSEDGGMYLFPGEKKVYDLLKPDWARIEKSEFTYNFNGKEKNVPILFCKGVCDRFQRPLACRIFPLTPYVERGELKIITDPRAKSVCPLSKGRKLSDFDDGFVRNVYKAFKALMSNREFSAFMEVYSEYLNDYLRFF